MPRSPRNVLPEEGTFHVFGRGVARAEIFSNADEYDLFWRLLEDATRRFSWIWHAACLMPNHYHLLVSARREALSKGMHRVNGCYARYFNDDRTRVGHVFQSRFGARVIEDESYLERGTLYVAGNAVRSGLCDEPQDWPWASLGHPLKQHSAVLG
jgi:REP element-mobilizing transposase RayT